MSEPFHGTDLLDVDRLLAEDERLVRDSVARWVDERWMPIVKDHFRNGTFPLELATELGAMGLLGTTLVGYGCPGLSSVAYGLAMEELERGDSGLRSFASVQDRSRCIRSMRTPMRRSRIGTSQDGQG